MITAERLNELIEQGATIWYANGFGYLEELKLDKVYLETEHELNRLYETKKHFDWACRMTAERTERFEPPMWEDIEKDGYLFTFIKPKDIHTIAFAVNWGVLWENEIVILYDDDYCVDECRTIFNEPATKENYIKACEIVRDLFNIGAKKN